MEYLPTDVVMERFDPQAGHTIKVGVVQGVRLVHLPSGFVEEEVGRESSLTLWGRASARLRARVEAWTPLPLTQYPDV